LTLQERHNNAGDNQEALLLESVCPKYGEPEVKTKNYTRKFAAISLLLSLPLFFFLKRFRCKNCGRRWK
jgi:hypothetical protein